MHISYVASNKATKIAIPLEIQSFGNFCWMQTETGPESAMSFLIFVETYE